MKAKAKVLWGRWRPSLDAEGRPTRHRLGIRLLARPSVTPGQVTVHFEQFIQTEYHDTTEGTT